jgi:hypothetical protein
MARAAPVLVLLTLPQVVSAQGKAPPFSVNRVECEWLDRAEFTRLLELELAHTDAQDLPPLTVDLACGEQGVTIIVRDPEWTQQIERTVPSPAIEGPGKERQVALTVAQFAGALWRLREAEEQEAAEQHPEPTVAEPATEPPASPPGTTAPPAGSGMSWSTEIGGGLRGRSLDTTPLLTGYGELSGAAWLVERVGIVALLDVEGGSADREGGSVSAVAISAGLGIAGLLLDTERFRLETRLLLAGGYARFAGHADDPSSHTDGTTDGGAGEVRGEIAPAIELGSFQIALAAQAG